MDPSIATVLRPLLSDLVDEVIEAVRAGVAAYARPLEGTFGDTVRRGVEVALGEFVDLIEQGGAPHPARRETHVKLGRLEFREHRPLEALLAAYRIGARTSWRRLVAVGEEAELTAPTLYQLGDAIFEYIDELSAAAAEGYADEKAASASEAQHRRRSLVRLAVGQPPPDPAMIEEAARAVGWELPRHLAVLAFRGEDPGRIGSRLGTDVVAAPVDELGCALIPDPEAPGRLAQLANGLSGIDSALGPTVHWLDAARSFERAQLALELVLEGTLGNGEVVVVADDHLAALVLHRDRQLMADLGRRSLAPLADVEPGFRSRLEETLRAWLDHQGHVPEVAEELRVHPQTVRYRLARLRALFGETLDDPSARFQLQLALHARLSAHRDAPVVVR